MQKFFIYHQGRCASHSLYNLLKHSLPDESVNAEYPSLFEDSIWKNLSEAECALAVDAKIDKFHQITERLDSKNWNLLIVTRNITDWLLASMTMENRRLSGITDNFQVSHPGKDHVQSPFYVTKSFVMVHYWTYILWHEEIKNRADYGKWGKIYHIDFDELTQNWAGWGKELGNWDWLNQQDKMMYGPSVSWKTIINLDEVIKWLSEVDPNISADIIKKIY